MIQTTLFNYFYCNGVTQSTVKKQCSFKQASLTDYYHLIATKKKKKTIKSKKYSILNYFKSKPKEEKEEEKRFDLVLVEILTSREYHINTVKKNMYDPDLKYICISYRWGELNEQQVETPDYIAHVTSFDSEDLQELCNRIKYEPDLKEIPYLWVDAISVDQQNHARKKDTILKMNQIYQHATYILAVPDLHYRYLLKNTANKEIIDLIDRYRDLIYDEIFNMKHSTSDSISDDTKSLTTTHSIEQYTKNDSYSIFQKLASRRLIKNNEDLKMEIKNMKDNKIKEDKKRIYRFLAYLIDEWSNRAWVISEYHIAKEKYKKHRTPLKYMFISLLIKYKTFFSYRFIDDEENDDHHQIYTTNNRNDGKNDNILTHSDVDDPISFNQFVKERFMQRSHLDMMLNSNATRNEDRFNAILPTWDEYKLQIKDRNTVSEWDITGMTSVRLKLYELMNDGDLWEKAKLLYTSFEQYSNSYKVMYPTFASNFYVYKLKIIEKMNYNSVIYKDFEKELLNYISEWVEEKEVIQMKQLMYEYKTISKPIWIENLTSIRFEQIHCYLSVKSNSYFIKNEASYSKDYFQHKLLLDYRDEIHCAFIPFFTFTIPNYTNFPQIYSCGSNIYLIGNKNKNKWILIDDDSHNYKPEHYCSDDYTFKIY